MAYVAAAYEEDSLMETMDAIREEEREIERCLVGGNRRRYIWTGPLFWVELEGRGHCNVLGKFPMRRPASVARSQR